jgi:hypothetical protein
LPHFATLCSAQSERGAGWQVYRVAYTGKTPPTSHTDDDPALKPATGGVAFSQWFLPLCVAAALCIMASLVVKLGRKRSKAGSARGAAGAESEAAESLLGDEENKRGNNKPVDPYAVQ